MQPARRDIHEQGKHRNHAYRSRFVTGVVGRLLLEVTSATVITIEFTKHNLHYGHRAGPRDCLSMAGDAMLPLCRMELRRPRLVRGRLEEVDPSGKDCGRPPLTPGGGRADFSGTRRRPPSSRPRSSSTRPCRRRRTPGPPGPSHRRCRPGRARRAAAGTARLGLRVRRIGPQAQEPGQGQGCHHPQQSTTNHLRSPVRFASRIGDPHDADRSRSPLPGRGRTTRSTQAVVPIPGFEAPGPATAGPRAAGHSRSGGAGTRRRRSQATAPGRRHQNRRRSFRR